MQDLDLTSRNWQVICAGEEGALIFAQLQDAAKEKAPAGLRLVKTTTGRRRIYLFEPEGSAQKFLVKAYLPADLAKRAKYLFRNSRCKQEFVAARKLAELGIPSVKAVVFAFRKSNGLPAEELVIEPFLEDLKNFGQAWKESGAAEAKLLFAALADLFEKLHDQGVLQRDFKPDSILVKKSGGHYDLILSDLERIKFYRGPLSGGQRIANLGKILQSFFHMRDVPEMEWLFEDYTASTGWGLSQGRLHKKVILSGIRQTKKHAEDRQSWAYDTNELIEKFEKGPREIRVSRELGKEALEKFLEKNELPHSGRIEIGGKKLDMIEGYSALSVMEKYYYLRELRIACQPVLLAMELGEESKEGLVGIAAKEGLVPVRNFIGPELKKERRIQALNALGKFLFRLDLFGLSFACYYGDLFKAFATDHTVEYCIFRPDLLSFSSSRKARIPVFDSSKLITRFIKEEFLEPSDIAFLREGYQSHRLVQPAGKN